MITLEEIMETAKRYMEEKAKGYVVRNARKEDLVFVQGINYRNLPENYPYTFFEDLYRRNPKAFYVAVSPEGVVVGYVMPRVERTPGFFRKRFVKSGHIVSIAVEKQHRRRGLGYVLMAYSLKSLRDDYGCSETYLEVRVSNIPAIALYKKLGYTVVKIAHKYYLDGEDAYIMARPL